MVPVQLPVPPEAAERAIVQIVGASALLITTVPVGIIEALIRSATVTETVIAVPGGGESGATVLIVVLVGLNSTGWLTVT